MADRDPFLTTHRRLIERLFGQADAARWGLTRDAFARALFESASRRFEGGLPSAAEIARYLESLHLADLALAVACREGRTAAWDHFVAEFRPRLYAAARAIAGDAGHRDLADSLYAELYGLDERQGERRSLLAYFHGRSSLATWLRSVLAQRHVDRYRASAHQRSLDELLPTQVPAAPSTDPPDPHRDRWLTLARTAVASAVAALDHTDRLRLAYYYGQGLTLAQIGRLTSEHESTISRKLERTRQQIRKSVDRSLRDEHRLTEAQVRLCYEAIVEDGQFDVRGLMQDG